MVSYCHDTREEGRAKTLLSSHFPMRTDPKGGRISSKASGRPASSSSFHHASPHVRPWSRCRPDLYPFLQTFAADWPGTIGRVSCREKVCQSVSYSVVPVSLTKKNIPTTKDIKR